MRSNQSRRRKKGRKSPATRSSRSKSNSKSLSNRTRYKICQAWRMWVRICFLQGDIARRLRSSSSRFLRWISSRKCSSRFDLQRLKIRNGKNSGKWQLIVQWSYRKNQVSSCRPTPVWSPSRPTWAVWSPTNPSLLRSKPDPPLIHWYRPNRENIESWTTYATLRLTPSLK